MKWNICSYWFYSCRKIIWECVEVREHQKWFFINLPKEWISKNTFLTTLLVSPKVACWLFLLPRDRMKELGCSRFTMKPVSKDDIFFLLVMGKIQMLLWQTRMQVTRDFICVCTDKLWPQFFSKEGLVHDDAGVSI